MKSKNYEKADKFLEEALEQLGLDGDKYDHAGQSSGERGYGLDDENLFDFTTGLPDISNIDVSCEYCRMLDGHIEIQRGGTSTQPILMRNYARFLSEDIVASEWADYLHRLFRAWGEE